MAVFIDGREYVPKTDLFVLTALHFEAAAKLQDPFAAIKWAHECQATVTEMELWSRAFHSEQEPEKPKKPAPLPVPNKPPKQLF